MIPQQSNPLFSDDSIAQTNKIKVNTPVDSEHKLHQKGVHTWFLVEIKLELAVYFCVVLTFTFYHFIYIFI